MNLNIILTFEELTVKEIDDLTVELIQYLQENEILITDYRIEETT